MKELMELAKEKGFSNEVNNGEGIFYDGDLLENEQAKYLWLCLLQKWLRDEHGVRVEIVASADINKYWAEVFDKDHETIYDTFPRLSFKPYEQALQEGCKKALELL